MARKPRPSPRRIAAYKNEEFLSSRNARALRILAEYLEPKSRFEEHGIEDTIVFFGSARLQEGNRWYEAARQLAYRLTRWSKELPQSAHRFVVCTGGGPGIMEAASRGASEAKGLSIGLGISLPHEQHDNAYLTRELGFHFHYFFMRKFWFAYLAKAVIVFPGGFGTLDELMEVVTLVQTRKMKKPMPIVLFGNEYWDDVLNLEAMVQHGTVSAEDLKIMHRTESVDDAFDWVSARLLKHALEQPGAML